LEALPLATKRGIKSKKPSVTNQSIGPCTQGLFLLSNTEQDWIEKYREAVLASSRTKESRFRSAVKAITQAVIAPLRKFTTRTAPIEQPAPSQPTRINSVKSPASQRQRKKKRAS
jgi:hypothetical protein